ncbi:MAG: DUF3618 domain-containing protein [Nostocoides sp.]
MSSQIANLEAGVVAQREKLAGSVDQLAGRLAPQSLVSHTVADVKARFYAATHTEGGDLRTERLAAVAGATVVVLGVIGVLRRRSRR